MGKIIVPRLEDILMLFNDVSLEVGEYLKEHFGKVSAQKKFENSPVATDDSIINVVTTADLEMQRLAAIRLLSAHPGFEFFGEEAPSKVFDPERDSAILERIASNQNEYQYVADVLDGTARYAAGDARYGTFLGLLKNKQFVVALGYMPHQDSMITAIRGKGCWRNGKPFRFDSSISDHVAVNSKIEREYKSFSRALLFERLESHSMRPIIPKHTGSMYDLLFQQQICAMISFRTNTHDHVLSLAVEEAGGYTLVYHNGEFVPGSEFDWRSEQAKKDANIMCYVAAKDKETALNVAELARQFFIFGKETDDYWKVTYLDEVPTNIGDVPNWVQLSPRDKEFKAFVNFRYEPSPPCIRKKGDLGRYMFELVVLTSDKDHPLWGHKHRTRLCFDLNGNAYLTDFITDIPGPFNPIPDITTEDVEREHPWRPDDRETPIYDHFIERIEIIRHLPDFIVDRIRASKPYYKQDEGLARFLKLV